MLEKKLENFDSTALVRPGSIIRIANRMLYNINKGIVLHNERTAYLALKLSQHTKMNPKCSQQNLVILALFHTIGFFRQDIYFNTNPFDSNINLFSYDKEIESKYIFGCYYLEFLTPLKKDALALEYLNHSFDSQMKRCIYQYEYKSILFLSAKISDFIKKNPNVPLPPDIESLAPGKFDPDYVELFKELNKNRELETAIKDGSYTKELFDYLDSIKLSREDTHQYLKFLVYLLDFKSTVTYLHTINTASYAYALGRMMNFSEEEMELLYISAVLHDIGKICIPISILEKSGELTPLEYSYMQKHVKHSKNLLNNLVPEEISRTVYQHHEKLNGKGYPEKLSGDEISKLSRALTVADIASALIDARSYKGCFPKEKTCQIMTLMTIEGELDTEICGTFVYNFDEIKEELPALQNMLKVNGLDEVLKKYNDYIFNNVDNWSKNVIDVTDNAIAFKTLTTLDDLEQILPQTITLEDFMEAEPIEEELPAENPEDDSDDTLEELEDA